MIYLFEGHDNNCSIVYAEETLTEQQKLKGVAIEKLPVEEKKEGKMAILKCKKATNEVWYEYVDIPRDVNSERISALEIAIANILGV